MDQIRTSPFEPVYPPSRSPLIKHSPKTSSFRLLLDIKLAALDKNPEKLATLANRTVTASPQTTRRVRVIQFAIAQGSSFVKIETLASKALDPRANTPSSTPTYPEG